MRFYEQNWKTENLALKSAQLIFFVGFIVTQQHFSVTFLNKDQKLPSAPLANDIKVLTLGESELAAKMLSSWLLSYDSNAGRVVQYDELDYSRLIDWLSVIQDLDLNSGESGMLATGVFIESRDRQRVRQMIEFVHRQFNKSPQVNWRWLAYAALQAKYRLGDLSLAREIAFDLRRYALEAGLPAWVRDMELLVLEDMGQFEAAIKLTDEMLGSGEITDSDELRYLNSKLKQLKMQLDQ